MINKLLSRTLTVLALSLMVSAGVFAQTVKKVAAQYDENQFPVPDILINEIVADTNANGEQLNDIYELELNQLYTITRSIVLNNPVTITAPEFDKSDTEKQPPTVRVAGDGDGNQSCQSGAGCFWILAGADISISNIYFGGVHTGNGTTSGNLLRPIAPDITIRWDNLIIDYMGWSIIANFDSEITGVSYISNNVYVKNAQNPGDHNSPFYLLNTVPLDTFIVRNVTYFQSHGFFMQSRTPMNYVEINHSTIANALRYPVYNEELTDAVITNNVFYNTAASGFTAAENSDQDRDGLVWSIINVDTLSSNEAGGDGSGMAEADRRIIVKNNVWYKSPAMQAYFETADSLVTDEFMNSRTQAMFDDDANYPGLIAENNDWVAFEFTNITEPGEGGLNADDEMIAYINNFRSGAGTDFWGFENDIAEFGENAELVIDWPMSEDLSHNITTIKDGQGRPVGDLKWFPNESQVVTSNESERLTPEGFSLNQNYPNPFNPSTSISFTLGNTTNVTLEVFNMLGQKVATLANNKTMTSGAHNVTFDASSLSSGVYIYRINTSASFSQTRKMLLIK